MGYFYILQRTTTSKYVLASLHTRERTKYQEVIYIKSLVQFMNTAVHSIRSHLDRAYMETKDRQISCERIRCSVHHSRGTDSYRKSSCTMSPSFKILLLPVAAPVLKNIVCCGYTQAGFRRFHWPGSHPLEVVRLSSPAVELHRGWGSWIHYSKSAWHRASSLLSL